MPDQCPSCGRFLSKALVASLSDAAAPCPGCAEELSAAMFSSEVDATSTSVRPPDLDPQPLRDEPDVLAGWDVGADATEVASWRLDRPPVPVDALAIGTGALLGAVLGAATFRSTRVRGAFGGLAAGVGVAGVLRQVWRLEPPV